MIIVLDEPVEVRVAGVSKARKPVRTFQGLRGIAAPSLSDLGRTVIAACGAYGHGSLQEKTIERGRNRVGLFYHILRYAAYAKREGLLHIEANPCASQMSAASAMTVAACTTRSVCRYALAKKLATAGRSESAGIFAMTFATQTSLPIPQRDTKNIRDDSTGTEMTARSALMRRMRRVTIVEMDGLFFMGSSVVLERVSE